MESVSSPQGEPDFGVLILLRLVRRHFLFLTLCSLVGVIVAGVLSFVFPAKYRAEATFLPSQQFTGSGSVLDATGLASAAREFGLGLSSDTADLSRLFPQLVSSRRLLATMAEKEFSNIKGRRGTLQDLLGYGRGDRDRERTLRFLRKKSVSASEDVRSGLSKVSVSLSDPVLAAQVANACVSEVDRINREELASNARRQVEFIAGRLVEVSGQLATAEDSLVRFSVSNRILAGAPQLQSIERRLKRSLELSEQLYVTLHQQLELARIEEVKNLPVITVIDAAVPPRSRQGPGHILYGLVGGIFAGIFALAWVVYANTVRAQ